MAKNNNINEAELAKYAAETEGSNQSDSIGKPIKDDTQNSAKLDTIDMGSIGRSEATEKLRQAAISKVNELREVPLEAAQAERRAELQEHNRSNGNGFLPINVEDLPTKGMFYPKGTRIHIKAATLGDIKHWSSTDETDISSIDEALNEIIKSCCYISYPESDPRYANWKDLLEIDRFYIIIAIHDFTYPPKVNDLRIDINETKEVLVMKDNIEFVKFSDKLMKFYNEEKQCFSFPVKAKCFQSGMMDVYLPSVGVTKWLKDYIQTRTQRQEGYDADFISNASLLIRDYRGLNNDSYKALVDSTLDWSGYEWSLITKVRSIIEKAITPVLKYRDESGVEQETPLNFRGGIKSIFQESLDIDL